MYIELTEREQNCLLELLNKEQPQLINELNHTDSREYKEYLKKKAVVLESLLQKFHMTEKTDEQKNTIDMTY